MLVCQFRLCAGLPNQLCAGLLNQLCAGLPNVCSSGDCVLDCRVGCLHCRFEALLLPRKNSVKSKGMINKYSAGLRIDL